VQWCQPLKTNGNGGQPYVKVFLFYLSTKESFRVLVGRLQRAPHAAAPFQNDGESSGIAIEHTKRGTLGKELPQPQLKAKGPNTKWGLEVSPTKPVSRCDLIVTAPCDLEH